ncbi:hypothetical protein PACTADRAFT_48830 [Pachysolen tannophilus NRRL Y-2460]|uniref:DNA repair and recombination protein RAD26 n=1 Tax=Pachysolen tannophilus NRRL Y-2460 TaxID=669874 RepID=A0A1E4TZ95_PACTA|nr:hypothetical protein PACTADRAFT_48830 [Pachysolen tannophilus NRRL Y-2460]
MSESGIYSKSNDIGDEQGASSSHDQNEENDNHQGNEEEEEEILEGPSSALQSLGVRLVEQDSLERKVAEDADKQMLLKDDELDQKRLKKTSDSYDKLLKRIDNLRTKLNDPKTRISEKENIRKDIRWLQDEDLAAIVKDLKEIQDRINKRKITTQVALSERANSSQDVSAVQLPSETRKEFLIRTGKTTAFGTFNAFTEEQTANNGHMDHQILRSPGLGDEAEEKAADDERDDDYHYNDEDDLTDELPKKLSKKRKRSSIEEEGEDEDDNDDEDFELSDFKIETTSSNTRKSSKKMAKIEKSQKLSFDEEYRNIDDGDENFYQRRLNDWVSRRSALRLKKHPEEPVDQITEEWFKPHPTIPDAVLNGEFKVPGDIYPSLFDYQKTGVQWLWELYSQKTGGIIGDEMGLGKTIQVISFLAGLHYSGKLNKPILIVCPATVLTQWCNEFHRWWPPLRTMILHSIGTGMSAKKIVEDDEYLEKMLEIEDFEEGKSINSKNSQMNAKEIVDRVVEKGHVLITTYVGLRIYAKHILPQRWGYVVLDEGHKIRNPNSDISLTCKQLKSHNRVILSGTPIQNNLVELWSLFDFIFPGRLGTLPVFQAQFSIPINIGGYANATNVQVQAGYKCAVILRDLISPYLLRRVKADVAKDLPAKNEMVLFCKLTKYQQNLYENFLHSEEMASVLEGKRKVLHGVDILRKICNHPDLVEFGKDKSKRLTNFGSAAKSGKMQVVKTLIEVWRKESSKILIFSQTRQMLDILEKFINTLNISKNDENEKFAYLRMDGTTPIGVRQSLVDRFNEDSNINIFLLTTRVGGLGVNLTGANRVIIYDPDWNPSTDVQARERAWRLGQKKDVTIYRLMIAGSIEEKIYHRQIFKQFLTNKILKDPKQRRFFKMNDLHDLFTLGDQNERGTETGDMFNGTEVNFEGDKQRISRKLVRDRKTINENSNKDEDDFIQVAQITGVSGLEKLQGDPTENKTKREDDERLMEDLFSSSGVHSALAHDSIMDSSRPETLLIEREATRIAEAASKMLRDSRKQIRRAKVGTPTFTGKFGTAGRSTNNPNYRSNVSSLSSSSILQNIKAKKELEEKRESETSKIFGRKTPLASRAPSPMIREYSGSSSDFSVNNNNNNNNNNNTEELALAENSIFTNIDKNDFISRIRDYLSTKKEGEISSSYEILTHLKLTLKNKQDMYIVRSMLKSICDWNSNRKGWVLKEEFK